MHIAEHATLLSPTSSQILRPDLRNLAIIAHVDHGKTTLVDHLLRQANVFRAHQQLTDLVMDSNQLERERGITILAKQTGVVWNDVRINIVDTPGHADFSGEVERVLHMADGCLLLVDAAEGPMPQTRYVLRKALSLGLKAIVVINKCDRKDARAEEVVHETQDLFLELATDAEQLDFPVIYAVGREGRAGFTAETIGPDLEPLFQEILRTVPAPLVPAEGSLQMLVSNLDYDTHLGTIVSARISRGTIRNGMNVGVPQPDGSVAQHRITALFKFDGLRREPIDEASAGDIVAVAGVSGVSIGQTVADAGAPEALPPIEIEDPTVRMTFGVNTGPFAGREGKYVTSREIRSRLWRELETNVAMRVDETDSPDVFLVSGRGELHLSILIETLRREGYEFQVSRPEAILHREDGVLMEPVEWLTLSTSDEYVGTVTELVGRRLAIMQNVVNDGRGSVRQEYLIPTRGIIGLRNRLLTATRGNVMVSSVLDGFRPYSGEIASLRSGALVAAQGGVSTTFGLNNAQQRGVTFIEPGTEIYEGMIVGQQPREDDLPINVAKEKKQSNVRQSTADISVRLSPPVRQSLEDALDFLADDELLEVTPKSLRLRKRILNADQRRSARNKGR
ncbi:MAG: translational GTPase TypA [Chloroflexota bacterium]